MIKSVVNGAREVQFGRGSECRVGMDRFGIRIEPVATASELSPQGVHGTTLRVSDYLVLTASSSCGEYPSSAFVYHLELVPSY